MHLSCLRRLAYGGTLVLTLCLALFTPRLLQKMYPAAAYLVDGSRQVFVKQSTERLNRDTLWREVTAMENLSTKTNGDDIIINDTQSHLKERSKAMVPFRRVLTSIKSEVYKDMLFHNMSSVLRRYLKSDKNKRQPKVNVVLSTWRSGSTFVAKMLASHPGLFYHYEPLLQLGLQQAREGNQLQLATQRMSQLATCNVAEDYINASIVYHYGLSHEVHWRNACLPHLRREGRVGSHWCTSPKFVRQLCRLFPYSLVKTVRVRLASVEQLLRDSAEAHVLVLARDPRGTRHSRRQLQFCRGREPLCDDPGLCDDLTEDWKTARDMVGRYPGRVRLVRLEDIIAIPIEGITNITDFFGLQLTETMRQEIINNTNTTSTTSKAAAGGSTRNPKTKKGTSKSSSKVYSTVRNSTYEAFHWQQEMTWEEVIEIQQECAEAMRLWGYTPARTEGELRSFNPVGAFQQLVT